ncbi:MAG: 5-formyltetrahydrofolate cyclo-ligase [Brachymonas sp.]|nr:5-formyltetrahydrofolate cyclo-ligase [Brachymonas sp.]
MNAEKKSERQKLLEARLNLPDRLERAADLQRALRAFLVGRDDVVIGAYWPIKGEFDALPALYRWQEDAVLNAQPERQVAEPLEPRFLEQNEPVASIKTARSATEFIANLMGNHPLPNSHTALPGGPLISRRKIGLPVVDRVHKTLQFHAWWPGCPMQEDAYNIPKPKDTDVVVPTLLLVPCLGFGPRGYRLGYGGGFYDRTLAQLQPKPFTVGLGFANAYVHSFQPEPHDIALDAILTDHGQMWPAE